MGADLKSYTTFQRMSLVLLEDCLVKLEHERTQDRVRRYMFDSIQSVVIWQKTSWWRIVVCIVFLLLPGIGILWMNSLASTVIGCLLIACGIALVIWYLYCKVTTIRIVRGDVISDLTGLFRPGRLRRFTERLITNIRTNQSTIVPPSIFEDQV